MRGPITSDKWVVNPKNKGVRYVCVWLRAEDDKAKLPVHPDLAKIPDKDKEVVFAFGEWDGKAPDRDSVYEIGSVSKAFTGILLADRVKAGVVRLDDPVQKYLPEGVQLAKQGAQEITLRHLATHTSGLPRLPRL